MRILIEGADLTGKSTLTDAVATELAARRIECIVLRGRTGWSPAHALLKNVDYSRHARSGILNSLYLMLSVLDRVFLEKKPRRTIIVHDSYIDRAIAYGMSLRLVSAAPLFFVMHWIFPKFDLAVLLTAHHQTRLARFKSARRPTENDRLTLDLDVHGRFQRLLLRLVRRHREWIVLPTDSISSQDLAVLLADNIEARIS